MAKLEANDPLAEISTISLTTLLKIALKRAIIFFATSTASVSNLLRFLTAAKAMRQSVLTFEDYLWKAMSFSTGFWMTVLKFCGL